MKKIKLLIAAILIIPFFCFSFNLKEEVKIRRLPTYIIENNSYLSLKSFLKIINSEDSWGRVEDRVFILHDSDEIKFRVGDKQIIIGGQSRDMEAPIKEIEGELLIPLEDFSNFFSEEVKPLKPAYKKDETVKPGGSQNQRRDFVILIDPGHGGKDAGAVGNFGLKEKDVNLDVALRMVDYLKKEFRRHPDIRFYMTRNTDIFVSLEDRVLMSQDIKADIFFSIHTNSSRGRRQDVSGFETYYPRDKSETENLPPPSNTEGLEESTNHDSDLFGILEALNRTDTIDESRILADFVQERMAEKLLTPDRGTKRRNFYVLKFTPVPAVLTEIGFICNPNIELNLRDAEVREAIAVTLGKALADYLKFKDILPDNT
jgi:N-acetylmuramoyl-L-alanine amidase